MTDNPHPNISNEVSHNGSAVEQIVNGTYPVIQDTKKDFQGLATSAQASEVDEDGQPLSHFHSLFYDLFTWKYPKATGFFFFATISLICAFHYVNVLRYVFKAAYMLFAGVAALEIIGKPLGAKGVVSSLRPRRYYTIPRESVDRIFEQVHDLANFFVLEFQRVVFVENIFTTLAAFVTSFFGYFLIKYIPLWTLVLLSTVTAFSAPLIYINNKEVIDEQLRNASNFVNDKLDTTKKLTGKYAEDAAARAKATAADLQSKVQGYTHKKAETNGHSKVDATAHDAINGSSATSDFNPELPNVPHHNPIDSAREPILA
jgi:hypothetical protein